MASNPFRSPYAPKPGGWALPRDLTPRLPRPSLSSGLRVIDHGPHFEIPNSRLGQFMVHKAALDPLTRHHLQSISEPAALADGGAVAPPEQPMGPPQPLVPGWSAQENTHAFADTVPPINGYIPEEDRTTTKNLENYDPAKTDVYQENVSPGAWVRLNQLSGAENVSPQARAQLARLTQAENVSPQARARLRQLSQPGQEVVSPQARAGLRQMSQTRARGGAVGPPEPQLPPEPDKEQFPENDPYGTAGSMQQGEPDERPKESENFEDYEKRHMHEQAHADGHPIVPEPLVSEEPPAQPNMSVAPPEQVGPPESAMQSNDPYGTAGTISQGPSLETVTGTPAAADIVNSLSRKLGTSAVDRLTDPSLRFTPDEQAYMVAHGINDQRDLGTERGSVTAPTIAPAIQPTGAEDATVSTHKSPVVAEPIVASAHAPAAPARVGTAGGRFNPATGAAIPSNADAVRGQIAGNEGEYEKALTGEANELKLANDDKASAQVKYQRSIDDAKKAHDARIASWNTQTATLEQELKDSKADPDRWWSGKSPFQKVLGTLGLALGTFGSMFTKTPNYALKIIDDGINRDLEAQKSERNDKWNLLKHFQQQGFDENQSYQLAHSLMERDLAHQLDAIGQQHQGTVIGYQSAQAAALARNHAVTEAEQAVASRTANDFAPRHQAAQLEQLRAQTRAANAEANYHNAQAGKASAATGKVGIAQYPKSQWGGYQIPQDAYTALDPELKATLVRLPDGSYGPSSNSTEASKTSDLMSAADEFEDWLTRAEQFSKTHGTTFPLSDANAAAKTLQAEGLGLANEVSRHSIRFSKQDVLDRLTGQVPNPGAIMQGQARAQLKAGHDYLRTLRKGEAERLNGIKAPAGYANASEDRAAGEL